MDNRGGITEYPVLIVDDEEKIFTLGKIFIGISGTMIVDTASSAANAIVKLSCGKYDGILSDYTMPDMNRMDLLRYLRAEIGDIPSGFGKWCGLLPEENSRYQRTVPHSGRDVHERN
jgi:DNA-binding NarL/FixJ family response regulator